MPKTENDVQLFLSVRACGDCVNIGTAVTEALAPLPDVSRVLVPPTPVQLHSPKPQPLSGWVLLSVLGVPSRMCSLSVQAAHRPAQGGSALLVLHWGVPEPHPNPAAPAAP